jgi:hypothetical protein
MTYGSNAYAAARLAEMHRAGAENRAADAARTGRVAMVIELMRARERRRSRAAQPAVAAAPAAARR